MPNSASRPTLTRRRFTQLSGMAVGSLALSGSARAVETPDVKLEIAPYTLEASPKHHIRTVAYNGQIPGPLFRMREGEPQSVEIRNLTKDSEVVHWHGLYLPPDIDGAMEEGTPMIAPGASTRQGVLTSKGGSCVVGRMKYSYSARKVWKLRHIWVCAISARVMSLAERARPFSISPRRVSLKASGCCWKRVPYLDVGELGLLFDQLSHRERVMVLLDAITGFRRSELMALKWLDVDFEQLEISVTRSIYRQVVGRCKTEISRKPVPLDPWVAEEMLTWKRKTPYNQPGLGLRQYANEGRAALQSRFTPEASDPARCEAGEDTEACRMAHLPANLLDLAEG